MGNKENYGGIFFSIHEVAKQVGVVPATIRNWEKAGLITPRRAPNGYRIFDLNDIELLKKIRNHSKEDGIGIKGIKMLCGFSEEETAPMPAPTTAVPDQLLGFKWKEYRLNRGYSLEEVANLVGVSVSYLSKIENAQANVSFDMLRRLATFYGENILRYLNDPAEITHVVKKDMAEPFNIGIDGLSLQSLISLDNQTMTALTYTVDPGCGRPHPTAHGGEEFVYVISGKVEFVLNGNQNYMLSTGDSISFQSSESHSWYNPSNKIAKLLWIYTPLTKL